MASRKQPQSSLRASTGTPARGAGVPPASSRVIDLTVWDSDADADEDAEQAACTERNNKNLISGGGGGDDTTASRAHHVASSRRGSSRKDPYEVPDSESDGPVSRPTPRYRPASKGTRSTTRNVARAGSRDSNPRAVGATAASLTSQHSPASSRARPAVKAAVAAGRSSPRNRPRAQRPCSPDLKDVVVIPDSMPSSPVRSPAVEGTRPSLAGNSQASPQHVKGDYANAAARTHLPAIKVEDVRRICRTTQADPKAEARDPVDWKESAPGGSSDVLDTTSSDGKPNPVSPMLSQPPVNEETVGPVFQSHIGPPAASRTSGPIERKAWWNPWDWSKRHYGTEFETSYVVGGLLGQSWIGNGPFRGYIISGPGEGGYIVGCRAPSDETLLQADLESAEVLAEDGEAASDNNWASDQFPDVEESDASDPENVQAQAESEHGEGATPDNHRESRRTLGREGLPLPMPACMKARGQCRDDKETALDTSMEVARSTPKQFRAAEVAGRRERTEQYVLHGNFGTLHHRQATDSDSPVVYGLGCQEHSEPPSVAQLPVTSDNSDSTSVQIAKQLEDFPSPSSSGRGLRAAPKNNGVTSPRHKSDDIHTGIEELVPRFRRRLGSATRPAPLVDDSESDSTESSTRIPEVLPSQPQPSSSLTAKDLGDQPLPDQTHHDVSKVLSDPAHTTSSISMNKAPILPVPCKRTARENVAQTSSSPTTGTAIVVELPTLSRKIAVQYRPIPPSDTAGDESPREARRLTESNRIPTTRSRSRTSRQLRSDLATPNRIERPEPTTRKRRTAADLLSELQVDDRREGQPLDMRQAVAALDPEAILRSASASSVRTRSSASGGQLEPDALSLVTLSLPPSKRRRLSPPDEPTRDEARWSADITPIMSTSGLCKKGETPTHSTAHDTQRMFKTNTPPSSISEAFPMPEWTTTSVALSKDGKTDQSDGQYKGDPVLDAYDVSPPAQSPEQPPQSNAVPSGTASKISHLPWRRGNKPPPRRAPYLVHWYQKLF